MAGRKHVPRIHLGAALAVGESITLPDAKRHHLATVLRLSAGASLRLFNGDGAEYDAEVIEASRKTLSVRIDARRSPARESALDLTLVQAVARGDRMDFALAKAVELGATRIRPVFCTRGRVRLDGERLTRKQAHWQAVVESAAEQSGRLICPPVAPAIELAQLMDEPPANDKALRLMLAPDARRSLATIERAPDVELLIGPESGLSDDEIAHARQAGWQALALGPRVLRTETAGMAALAALQTAWGDLADT